MFFHKMKEHFGVAPHENMSRLFGNDLVFTFHLWMNPNKRKSDEGSRDTPTGGDCSPVSPSHVHKT